MRGLIIGTGAAGNKAAIELLQKGYIKGEDLLLVNSTLLDIPEEYRGYAVQLSPDYDGCGKERTAAKNLTYEALNNGTLNIDAKLLPEHEKVIIISSIEGGTGSGSSMIMAKHIYSELGYPVELIGFAGFEEDCRGLANEIEWFKESRPEFRIQTISNAKFLKAVGGRNKLRAEKLANEELCRRIALSLGLVIKASEQNIDKADIEKLTNSPGYCDLLYIPVADKIKSFEQFNDLIKNAIDETKSIEVEDPCAIRLGMVFNLQPSSQEFIDYSYEAVKARYAVKSDSEGSRFYEVFTHVQYDKSMEEFIGIIVSGMHMPIEETRRILEKYNVASDAINTTDSFYDEIETYQGNARDNKFDMLSNRPRKKKTYGAIPQPPYTGRDKESEY